MIKLTRINEAERDGEDWLIPGILCPWLTLLSGQPKHGKSLFAGHLAMSLVNRSSFLGREVSQIEHQVGWMGFDAGWKVELRNRWNDRANNRVILVDPIRTLDKQTWRELAVALHERNVTLLVIDHLYGLAGVLGLNDAENFAIIANLLRPLYEEYQIAVLLLAQAGKSEFSKGRAAHSVALEGEARSLIRIYEKRTNGRRKLDLSSNTNGELTISIVLTPEELAFTEFKSEASAKRAIRETPDAVRKFLSKCNDEDLKNWSAVGRALFRLGLSSSADAGRQMSNRWRNQGLLKLDSGIVVAGDSLLNIRNVEEINTFQNAS